MKTGRVLFIVAVFLVAGLCACQTDISVNKGVCTTEFRSVGLMVSGDSLTDFYTFRIATLDTIRSSTGVESRTHWYLVLDDSYQHMIADKQETFRFIGKKGQTVIVREDYLIAADQCHIRKISGKSGV